MVPRQWTESPSFFSQDRPAARIGPPTQKLNVSSQISISKNRQVSFAPVGQPKPSTSQVSDGKISQILCRIIHLHLYIVLLTYSDVVLVDLFLEPLSKLHILKTDFSEHRTSTECQI